MPQIVFPAGVGFHCCHITDDKQIDEISSSYVLRIGEILSRIEQGCSTQEVGIKNIVFNKVVGSMQNIASSLNMETRLKKWRSAMEAVISNIKRRFNIRICNWKGWVHFQAKVLWSVLAYNFRVMTGIILDQLGLKPKVH